MVISIRMMSGPLDGQRLSFAVPTSGGPLVLTLGRMETCDVSLSFDGQVSRTHARLFCALNREALAVGGDLSRLEMTLEDFSSRNGTFIGDQRLGKHPATLVPGQLFRVGRTWLRVEA